VFASLSEFRENRMTDIWPRASARIAKNSE
jgi:hypothetical protein